MRQLLHDEDGTTSVEYALLLSVLVLVTLGAWRSLGEAVQRSVTASVETISEGQP